MIVLAIDHAGATGSVALVDTARPAADAGLGQHRTGTGRDAADRLVALVDRLLAETGLRYRQIDVIAVNRGPGSFTGTRSAIALGRGLALAADRPVLGVTGFEVLAAAAGVGAGQLVTALDARRGEVYVQAVDAKLRMIGVPQTMTPAEVVRRLPQRPLRLVGSGGAMIGAHLGPGDLVPGPDVTLDAAAVARRAVQCLAQGAVPTAGVELQPLYLRPPDARPAAPLLAAPAPPSEDRCHAGAETNQHD